MATLASKRERCYWNIWADSSKSLVLALYSAHALWGRGREGGRESARDTELERSRSSALAFMLSQSIMEGEERADAKTNKCLESGLTDVDFLCFFYCVQAASKCKLILKSDVQIKLLA